MASNLPEGKQLLAVDDERDVPEIESTAAYENAADKKSGLTSDLVILDIMGERGFELLEQAIARKVPVVELTAHSVTADSLKKSIELGARPFVPKDQLGKNRAVSRRRLFLG